jgi:hypothetical protein
MLRARIQIKVFDLPPVRMAVVDALDAFWRWTTHDAGAALVAFWHWTTHDAVATYTAVLAISTILLWIATACGIRNQRRDTEILQRAYLSVEPGGIHEPFDRGDRVQGRVICRNRGRLPARKLSWHLRTDIVQPGAKEFPIGEMSEPRGVVAPGTEMIVSASWFFTERLQNALFVWGMVTYDDGFGKRRYTKFCHWYPTKPFLGSGIFHLSPDAGRMWEYGNDAD